MRAAGLERAAVRLAVDAARHAADDDEPGGGELAAERARDVGAVRRARAGADDRDRGLARAAPARPSPRRKRPSGGSKIAAQRRREGRGRSAPSQRSPRAASRSGTPPRRSRRRKRPNARRPRLESDVAAASRRRRRRARARSRRLQLPRRAVAERLGDVLGQDVVGRRRARRPSAPRARRGRGRGPRAAAARPRATSSSSASGVRRGVSAARQPAGRGDPLRDRRRRLRPVRRRARPRADAAP